MLYRKIVRRLTAGPPLDLRLRPTPLHRALRKQPMPLLDPGNRMIISWSPRAGTTHLLIWHLARMGLLDEAERHAPWPHRYRVDVYYRRRGYRDGIRRLKAEGPGAWTLLKVARDPVKRCVSSYRYALSRGYADRKMERVLGRPVDHREGFSYETFLDYLARVDLARCDPHHRLQTHPVDLWSYGRVHLIDIDARDLDVSLREVERIHGIERAGTVGREEEMKVSRLARRNAPRRDEPAQDVEIWRRPLARADTTAERWPKAALEACAPAARKARALYARDYEVLGELAGRSNPR